MSLRIGWFGRHQGDKGGGDRGGGERRGEGEGRYVIREREGRDRRESVSSLGNGRGEGQRREMEERDEAG